MVNEGGDRMDSSQLSWRGWGPWSQTKIMQSSPDQSSMPQRQALSSLMDGDLPAGELAGVIARFRDDGDLRADWHAFHLIGDVLRSEDLALAPARDACFLQALRSRLDQEPQPQEATPLLAAAPQPAMPLAPGRRRWGGWIVAPAAVAAGFVVVAGVLVVNKALVSAPAAEAVIAQQATAPGVLVRDARLDRYLAAHRNLGTGLAGAGAGGAERTVQIVFEPK
jgi:sigma-E factor negative regulatory protein RseA